MIHTDNRLYQNEPNPFKENTIIGFDLSQSGPVTLSISDATGRVLNTIETIGIKGYNVLELSTSELNATGLLIYKLESGEFIDSKKMIIIK